MPQLGLSLGTTSTVSGSNPVIWKVAIFGSGQFDPEGDPWDLNMEYVWNGSEKNDGQPVLYGVNGVGPDQFHPQLIYSGGNWQVRYDGNPYFTTPDLINPDWNREDSSYPFAPAGDTVSYDLNSFINYLYFPTGPEDFNDGHVDRQYGGAATFSANTISVAYNLGQNNWEGLFEDSVLFTTPDFFHYSNGIYAVIGYSA